ncbi:hypothetical protein KIPB_010817 [Kipferlia bialata]|uniref:Uncharacterized protein n=1 Tax=Kipferlia bialata TaxID=797122 RepID=A0A9K3GLU5_9EUKA|nr:hypothetical protein KIPB_010817 [Kipferlia bialata]|eukprot:g10817.t1
MNTCQVSFIRGLVLPLLKLFSSVMDALGEKGADGDGEERDLLTQILANVTMNLQAWEMCDTEDLSQSDRDPSPERERKETERERETEKQRRYLGIQYRPNCEGF